MQDYKRRFFNLALSKGNLRFGSFTLKSGRTSPYFFNAGGFDDGQSLSALADCYAEAILDSGCGFDMLFGPAYKGIPLAAAVAIALSTKTGRAVPYCFNRKEAKDHGEGGLIVGAELAGRVVIVDDVVTAGISVDESVEIIRGAGAVPTAVCIALDRMERGLDGELPTSRIIAERHGIPVLSIADLDALVDYLDGRAERSESLDAIKRYRERYGVVPQAPQTR